jgi:segregation and condensation protein B
MTDTPPPEPEPTPAAPPAVPEASAEPYAEPHAEGRPGSGPQEATRSPEPHGEGRGRPGPYEATAENTPHDGEPYEAAAENTPHDGESYGEGRETTGPDGRGEPSPRAGLEAILMVVDEPVPEVTLAQILERPRHEVAATLRELAAEYTAQGRGFELREIAGGWRFYTRETCAPLVERFVRDGQQARLTQAALETLAVVAYRQPVSRARVAAIRGVNSDGVIRTLTLRGLIEEAGHDPEHQAVLYRTSAYFLERLGLNSLDELPDLAPYLPDDVEGIEELQQ